jgi:hypothetical protein
VIAPTTKAANGTFCVYDEVQWFRNADSARRAFAFVRDSYAESVNDPELPFEILKPAGLVDDTIATHAVRADPDCPWAGSSAHLYHVIILRSNVHALMRLWSNEATGPEQMVELARIQADRIEGLLSKD